MQNNTVLKKTIIDELGLGGLPQDKQDEMMVKIGEVIVKRIYLETLESLPENDREELAKMLDAQTEPDKIEEFLKGKIGNYDDLVKKIIEDFKNEMKGVAGNFDNKYKE